MRPFASIEERIEHRCHDGKSYSCNIKVEHRWKVYIGDVPHDCLHREIIESRALRDSSRRSRQGISVTQFPNSSSVEQEYNVIIFILDCLYSPCCCNKIHSNIRLAVKSKRYLSYTCALSAPLTLSSSRSLALNRFYLHEHQQKQR